MTISRRALHGTLIAIWSAVALYSAGSLLYCLFVERSIFLATVVGYGLMTAVSSVVGYLRILAGRPGGGSLIYTPCVPPLLLLLWVLLSAGRGVDEFGLGEFSLIVPLAFAFLLWRAARNGKAPSEIVADAGYDSHEGLAGCEAAEVGSVVIAQRDNTGLFWTVVSETEVLCPMGRPAERGANATIRGVEHQVLRVSGCPSCIFFGSCCTARSGRSLKAPLGSDPVARVLAAHRARSAEGKRAMVERMATVEPFFA